MLSWINQFVETLARDDFLVLLFISLNVQAKGTYNYSVNPLITSCSVADYEFETISFLVRTTLLMVIISIRF